MTRDLRTGDEARAEILARLWAAIEAEGSMNAVARKWGVSVGYLSDVWRGRCNGGNTLLTHMGMRHIKRKPYTVEVMR